MGFLDSILGSAVSSLDDNELNSPVLDGVLDLIKGEDGVRGVSEKLIAGGLGDKVASWVGLGDNETTDGTAIESALGSDKIREVAARAGIDEQSASEWIAKLLPSVINGMTPKGVIEDPEE